MNANKKIFHILFILFLLSAKNSAATTKNKRSSGWVWGKAGNNNKSNEDQIEPRSDEAQSRVQYTFGYYTHRPWTLPTTQRTTTPSYKDCTCVPYYRCEESQVVTDGKGVIDIRKGWPCKSILEVCCRKPQTSTTKAPTTNRPGGSSTALPGFKPRCGTLNPNGINARILGFQDAETQFGEYPWMGAILEKKYLAGQWVLQFLCGASLVWPSAILTAAHCVKGKKAENLIIRLGEWDTQSENEFYSHQDIAGWEIIIHPDFYGGALYNDIAIVTLESSAILSPHIDTICIALFPDPLIDNATCWATGWGRNAFGKSGEYQEILKEVQLPIVPRKACQSALRKTNLGSKFKLHDSFTCAGGLKGYDTCVGDGGGPLVCRSLIDPWRYLLIGITSWGVGCGKYGVPGVYVDVSKLRDWIEDTLTDRIDDFNVDRITIFKDDSDSKQYG